MEDNSRPNPDELLAQIKTQEEKEKKGKLKLYLGMCAGVGKTFAMLQDASKTSGRGIDVLIGYVETHGRAETEFLLFYLPQLPRKKIEYKGIHIEEMDLDEILLRKPKLVVVDELAHTNAPGCRHTKRYLDVIELLDNGIDVYTAVNVQHIESLADTVTKITGIAIHETVPDSILDLADEIEMVDISPEELLQRLKDGKVYTQDKSPIAIQNFFRKGNLAALRELALRLAADRVDKQVRDYMQEKRISGPWKTRQRILIGIGPNPDSVNLIRDARRIAYTMEASLVAVHVDVSHNLSTDEISSLNKNMELARELGAEIISTSDVDIVNGILRIAKQQNVSHIIIGKSNEPGLFSQLFRKDIVSRLIKECGSIDIYISSHENQPKNKKIFTNVPKTQSGILKYFISALIVILISILCLPFSDYLGYKTVALIFLLTVSLLPLFLGPGPVLLASVLSPLMWNYFFVPPRFTLMITKSEDVLTFILFFIIAFVTGVLTTRIRQRERAVRQREERAVALYNLANDLSKAKDLDEVISESIKNIKRVFSSGVIILLADETDKLKSDVYKFSSYNISEKEFSVAQWVFKNGRSAGKFTDSLPFAESIYYPIKGPRDTYGVIGLKIESNELTEEQKTLLENFINQIGSAVEREFLNETAKHALILEESEKLYKTLFDSISHELKTPIAAIMGASSFLISENNYKPETNKQLYDEIHIAAIRLNRLVENLLDMARLESGRMIPNIASCDVQDLFNSALNHFETELKSHNVIVDIPDNFPFIKVDFVLLEQVLRNLLQNSLIYTKQDSTIELHASYDVNNFYIIYSDSGQGISDENLNHIFDKFYRIDKKISGGTGLGLSIAKGIVEAHKGTITAGNKQTGGLKFTIAVPQNFKKKDEEV